MDTARILQHCPLQNTLRLAAQGQRKQNLTLREKQWTLHTSSSTAPGHPKARSSLSEDGALHLPLGEAMDIANLLQHCPLQDTPRLAADGQRTEHFTS